MAGCCGRSDVTVSPSERSTVLAASSGPFREALEYFQSMIQRCVDYARAAKASGCPIVGIMCEYTPRELIMAMGGVPVCLCGGSVETIPAAEEVLPSNLCPLIKSTFGYHRLKSNPLLELTDLVVGETTCDGKKKMYEVMGEERTMYVLALPPRQNECDARDHWRREVVKLKEALEKQFKTKITEEGLRRAVSVLNCERQLRRKIAELMKEDVCPLSGRQVLEFKSSISAIPEDLVQYERIVEAGASPCCTKELEANRAVRVLLTGVPVVHGAERVVEIIENHGGLVVCMENCTGIKPILEDVDDTGENILEAIADKYFHIPCSVQTPNQRRLEVLQSLIAEYRPQCVIELVWQACLTYDIESTKVKELSERMGLPYLRINTDYSPSDTARITVRVEALFETVRSQATCRSDER